MMLACYLGFAACFWLGRCYEAERQDKLRRRGTLYEVRGWRLWIISKIVRTR